MFSKFLLHEVVGSQSEVRSSQRRAYLKAIKEQYPKLDENQLDKIIPKKSLRIAKCPDHINVLISGVTKQPLFFSQRDGPWYPSLRLLHLLGNFMPILGVDAGAVRFVMSGANIMCPGITNEGGAIPEDLPVDTPVQIMAEGKELPLAVGVTKMSTDDIKSVNKGIGVEVLHFLDDGLWRSEPLD